MNMEAYCSFQKFFINKDYFKEFINRVNLGDNGSIFNPNFINQNFYFVIEFEEWIELLKTNKDITFNVTNDDIKMLLLTYDDSINSYHNLYKIFAKELKHLNEYCFFMYNKYLLDMSVKKVHNNSPKLFLPHSIKMSDNANVISHLVENTILPKSLEIPTHHQHYNTSILKREYLLGAYNNYLSIYEKNNLIYTNKIYLQNDI